jgi:hypothetical protein
VTYVIARSVAVYVVVMVLTALTAEDQRAEAGPVAAHVPELALEEVVAPPPVAVEAPGVCT